MEFSMNKFECTSQIWLPVKEVLSIMSVIFYKPLKRFSVKQTMYTWGATNFGHLINKSSAYFCSDWYSENFSWISQFLCSNLNFGISNPLFSYKYYRWKSLSCTILWTPKSDSYIATQVDFVLLKLCYLYKKSLIL